MRTCSAGEASKASGSSGASDSGDASEASGSCEAGTARRSSATSETCEPRSDHFCPVIRVDLVYAAAILRRESPVR